MGPDPSPPAGPAPGRRALRQAALTLYGTLVLVGVAIPDAVVNALREAPPGVATAALLAAVEPAAGALEATGVPGVFRAARERFRQLSCGGPDSQNPC